ncbi:MAG: (2Fe-2S)-binding protein [Mycobacterium sp.]
MSRAFFTRPEPVCEVSELSTAGVLAEISQINDYFAVGTGPIDRGWRSLEQLYTDHALLDGIVGRVQTRIGAPERRVAVSIFFLGLAARLWSVGIGAVVGHGLLPDLAADRLLFRETGGQITLHIARPVGRRGDDLAPMLADTVLDGHLTPLGAALRQVSQELLRGNAASALLGAAHQYERHRAADSAGPARRLARSLCNDQRLAGAVIFGDTGYRRSSCCLYYRVPNGGVCGDCVFTHIPGTRGRKDAS